MGRGGRRASKLSTERKVRSKDKWSDESDEDYTVGEDENLEESEDYCSLAEDESEGSVAEYDEEEEEEEKMRKVVKSKGRKNSVGRKKAGVGKARTRPRVTYEEEAEDDDDDDEDYGDEDYDNDGDEEEQEEKVRTVLTSKGRKNNIDRKKAGVGKVRTRKRVSYEEEVEDDDDELYDDKDYDNDDDDGEDNDDEFMPDEIDSLDDEDELPMTKKNKKLRRPQQGKGFTRGKKRKRKRDSNFVKKPVRKKERKNVSSGRKIAADIVGEFKAKKSVSKGRSKRSSGHQRKLIAHSESDFVSSESSDFEYTVSEEEREQMREASEFCRSLTATLRSSSSSKKVLEEEQVLHQQRKHLRRKGKEKVEDLKNVAGKQVCGICLSEEGKRSVRGTLNCCSHYFCFACIMEWSKVESRCPLCKQRFATISKPARSNTGFDLRTVVIQVPERDQVYQPSEEELRGYLDPYESVLCTECLQGGDDAHMLLCDLCDSPAHTYCVGLGHEVPEGNWYCEGCRPTAVGSSTPQALNPTTNQRTSTNLMGGSSPGETVGLGLDLNVMYVPDTPLTQGPTSLSSTRSYVQDSQSSSPASRVGAFTVSERRRIQRQIHHLLNNRLNILRGRTHGMSATNSGNNFFGSQMDLNRELAHQPTITLENAMPSHTSFERRVQDDSTHSLHNRDLVSERLSHSRGQASQGPTLTSTSTSVNGIFHTDLPGISTGVNLRSSYELHPCSSRPSFSSDGNMSPYVNIEATVPSRTLQRPPNTPF